jgi:hypothetical protein
MENTLLCQLKLTCRRWCSVSASLLIVNFVTNCSRLKITWFWLSEQTSLLKRSTIWWVPSIINCNICLSNDCRSSLVETSSWAVRSWWTLSRKPSLLQFHIKWHQLLRLLRTVSLMARLSLIAWASLFKTPVWPLYVVQKSSVWIQCLNLGI